jgi:fructose-1,6-bisphosphatase
MCDESAANAKAVERHYAPMSAEESYETKRKAFIDAARGDMSAKAPFNYYHVGATVSDMMQCALNTKGGVTIESLFSYVAKNAQDGCDDADAMMEALADQFIWRAF